MEYGLGVIGNSISFRLNKWGLAKSRIYKPKPRTEAQKINTAPLQQTS
jgi:hypothetical protein